MAKRRTKKQKLKAKHNYFSSENISYNFNKRKGKSRLSEPTVKGQFDKEKKQVSEINAKRNYSDFAIKNSGFEAVRLDLVRSLLISILIISFELMLYLNWK